MLLYRYIYNVYFHDTDDKNLDIKAEYKPEWLTLEKTGNKSAVLKGKALEAGEYVVVLTVSDGETETHQEYTIVVEESLNASWQTLGERAFSQIGFGFIFGTCSYDGDVYTFCPEADSRCVILTEFATSLEVAKSNVFHDELVDCLGEFRTINYWQNPSADLMPHITAADVTTSTPASVHDQIKEITVPASGATPATVVTIDHVMGVFYDKY